MRDQDKDLDVPSFGPAEREPAIEKKPAKPTPAEAIPAQTASSNSGGGGRSDADVQDRSSGGGLSFLILILLAAAVAGLTYWGYMQHQQLQSYQENQQLLEGKVTELQQLLQVAESSAAESGESFLDTLKQQGAVNQDKFKQLDSEVAKLWVVAHQRNTPKIAELEKQLKAALAALAKQEKAAAAQAKKATALVADMAKLQATLKGLKKADAQVEQQIAAIKKSTASVSAEFQVLTESVELQQAEQKKILSGFAEQIVALQNNQNSAAGLERRVRVNEQAVKAIDGSRILLNKELLQIRQKLNNLQLQVEKL